MTTIAIEYIWQAIRESERSDEPRFIDGMSGWTPPARSDAIDRGSITLDVIEPLPVNRDSLPTVTLPPGRGHNGRTFAEAGERL